MNYVRMEDSLDSQEWFFGTITREEAERCLMLKNIEIGVFLIRESASCPGSYVLSLKDYELEKGDCVKHYKLRNMDHGGVYLSAKRCFESVIQLVDHYKGAADGLCQVLKAPCPRVAPILSDLSQETKDAWEVSQESLEFGVKLGAGQFGEVWKGSSKHSRTIYALYDYNARTEDDLNFKKGDKLILLDQGEENDNWWYAKHRDPKYSNTKQEGYVPRNYFGMTDTLVLQDWFFGTIIREEANRILMYENIETGVFLVRESETCPGSYVLSLKDYEQENGDCVKHYKLRNRDDGGVYIAAKRCFDSVIHLVDHYKGAADGLCRALKAPCPRVAPKLSDLSQETKDACEISRESLTFGVKLGAGQFGEVWKEQRDIGDFDDVDPRYFNAYIDALKDGKEKTNLIRVNIVGNAYVGKSTLTKKLLGMVPDRNIDRTDGIEVHCYKCNDSCDWSTKDVPSNEKTAQRIAMSSDAKHSKEQPIELYNTNTSTIVHQSDPTEIKTPDKTSDYEIVPTVSQTSLYESLQTNVEQGPLFTIPTFDLNINETEKERLNRFSSKEKEMINIFSSKLKEGHLTDVTCIQIWDFGGQFDYYATHQLFHSQRAVYLLVLDASADLNDITETCELTNASGDKDVKYFCKFWMHSIHSFVGNDKNEPPVILVATKTDKKIGWNEEKQKEFFESVRKLFDGTPVGLHIQSKCFAVNIFSENAADFNNLRKYIEEVAKSQESWNSSVPTRWIPLEDSLRKRSSEKHLTLKQIRTIGSELNVPINDEPQIKAFLMYHHSLGNLVYFDDDDLSESTVIDPQWIIDAFKTIITTRAKQYCLENGPLRDKWEQLTKEAILSKELIKAVWNIDNENDFSSNEDILLKYLIKLGIISEVTELDLETHDEDHKDHFFVPSLLSAKSSRLCLEKLMKSRTVTQTALVFAFEDNHVPLLLHHRLTAAALGKWNVLVFGDQRMLAENIGVYELDEVHAGLIEVCDTSIEIRVINLCGGNINPTQTDKLRRFVRFKIDAEFQRFSKLKSSPYTLRIRCNFNNNKGKQTIELSKLENSEYASLPCPDKDPGHNIKTADIRNQWSYTGVNISRDKTDKELLESLRDNSRRDLTLSVTEREFSKVAYAIGQNWELLGINLGLSKASIDQIKIDNPGACKTQIFQMLKTWAEKEGEEASMEKLLAAIVGVVDMTVDWDKIKNILDE